MNKNVKTYSVSASCQGIIYLFCLTWCTKVTKTKIHFFFLKLRKMTKTQKNTKTLSTIKMWNIKQKLTKNMNKNYKSILEIRTLTHICIFNCLKEKAISRLK